MFVDESLWIKEALARVELGGKTLLDVGSSTLHFRTVAQPWVDRNVFVPLRERGVVIKHLDAKQAPGVDIVCDVTRLDRVDDGAFDVVLCTNLLEHVVDREETMRHVRRVVAPGGWLLLTVPRRYPIHPDPIDTGYRPDAAELVRLAGWPDVVRAEVVDVRDPEHYRGARFWRRLFRPWQITCVLVRRP